MIKLAEDNISHAIRMMRWYSDQLTVHKEDGGTFTYDQLQETDQLADDLGALSESSSDDGGSGETGGSPPNP